MKLSRMHKRVNQGNFNTRHNPPQPATVEVPQEGHYGRYGWEGPNKADKGQRLGSCNVTRCQRPGAYWWNKGSRAWYCTDCARRINDIPLPDGSLLCAMNVEAEEQYFHEMNF